MWSNERNRVVLNLVSKVIHDFSSFTRQKEHKDCNLKMKLLCYVIDEERNCAFYSTNYSFQVLIGLSNLFTLFGFAVICWNENLFYDALS